MSKNNRITYRFDRQGNKIEDVITAQRGMQPSTASNDIKKSMSDSEKKWEFKDPTISIDEAKMIKSSDSDGWHNSENYTIDIDHLEQMIRQSNAEKNVLNQENKMAAADINAADINNEAEDIECSNAEQKKASAFVEKKAQQEYEAQQTSFNAALLPFEERGESDSDNWYGEPEVEQQRRYEMDLMEEEREQFEGASSNAITGAQKHDDVWLDNTKLDDLKLEDTQLVDRRSMPWLSGAISVISAIATGICIGYLLLSLVFGISVWPLSVLAKPSETETGSLHINDAATQQTESKVEQGEEKVLDPATALQLSDISFVYHVLQAGVFTQEKTRDEVLASLKQAGYSGHYIQDSNHRYFVYAGVATSATNAAPIQTGIKGIETYRKEMTIQLPDQIAFKGEAQLLEQYFADSNALIAIYADLIAAQLEQTSFSKIGSAAQEVWQAAYGQWLTLADQLDALWVEEEDQQQAIALKEQMMLTEQQLQNYQAEPKSMYLWAGQSSLVKSVLIQKDWFE